MTPTADTSDDDLTTFAPALERPPNFIPTGNLAVAIPEIDRADGSVRSLGVVLASCAGILSAHGGTAGLAAPFVTVDGRAVALQPEWERDGEWIPHFTCGLATGDVEGWYLAPVDERGVVLRLRYRHTAPTPAEVTLAWRGSWDSTTVEHLRAKPVECTRGAFDDAWTGSRVVSAGTGLPLLALAWRAGSGMDLGDDGSTTGWRASTSARVSTGEELFAEVAVGVAPESDGAAATALHLRRRGFDDLFGDTMAWLGAHRLAIDDEVGGAALAAKLNTNLFFSWFYAQGDCLDTQQPVLCTSRSPRYYVCGAFWSRDAYCWTFPSLLLVDAMRAREVLVRSILAGGVRLADHALYLNGTSLYPGFELDQAAAPVLAVARYVRATGDWAVLAEPGLMAVLVALLERVGEWRHPKWDLYATFLLPTDDPTDHPYLTTDNALLAAAFAAFADLLDGAASHDVIVAAPRSSETLRARAAAIRSAIGDHLVVDGPYGAMWAWACDVDGRLEVRDEPPLGLLTLPYWGVGEWDGPLHRATRSWLASDYEHHYPGRFGGAGAPHFPYPSGFDLANRLLDLGASSPDPLVQFAATPMDQGLACESWDPEDGRVVTGAAMASMAGLLVWTAWARLNGERHWDDP